MGQRMTQRPGLLSPRLLMDSWLSYWKLRLVPVCSWNPDRSRSGRKILTGEGSSTMRWQLSPDTDTTTAIFELLGLLLMHDVYY